MRWCGCRSSGPAAWTRLATRLRWVSSTAFGRPVVPLDQSSAAVSVDGSTWGAPGSSALSAERETAPGASPSTITSSSPASAAAARAPSSNAGAVMRTRASVSFNWRASSGTGASGLAARTAAPARSEA